MFGSPPFNVNQPRRWRFTAYRIVTLAGAQLFPPRCCLCGFEGMSAELDLCTHCHEALPWISAPDPRMLTPLRFVHPADDLIRAFKYRGQVPHARLLGGLLAQSALAARRAREDSLPTLLLPVPLNDARLRERGFNQAALIARHAASLLGVACHPRAMSRVRDTPSQTGLSRRQRKLNVRDAFVLDARGQRKSLAHDHVAIVDDVLTTGATMNELRRVLLDAGIRRVDVWAVARAI